VKVAVLLRTPRACHGRVVLGQELLMKSGGQDPQDLDRVIGIDVMRRRCSHVTHHRASAVHAANPRSRAGQAELICAGLSRA